MEPTNTMLKPISNGPIPPVSPVKQLILRLAGELARLHDSQPSTLDLIAEARTYLDQPEPEGPTDEELLFAFYEASLAEGGDTDEVTLRGLRAVLARWGK